MTYFIALIIFLLPSYLLRFSVFGIPMTMLEILIYIAFVWTIIIKITNHKSQINPKTQIPDFKQFIIHNSSFIIPIILFIISGIISVAITPDKREALGLFKAYILDPIIFFWIIIVNIQDTRYNNQTISKSQIPNPKLQINLKSQISNLKLNPYDLWIKALILSGVVVALHAIWQKITGDVAPDGRVQGIFSFDANSSPNYLAFYLTPIAVLINGYEMLIIGDNWKNIHKLYKNIWYYDLAFFLIIVAIWLSGSRAAIGAGVVGIISFFIIKYWKIIKSKRIFVFMFLCSCVLVLLVGWQQTKPDWSFANTEGGRITSSNNIRWEIWKTTTKDILPHNLVWLKGVGLGNYQSYFTELTKDRVNFPEWISPLALTPHNLFLNIWVNLGLLGLVSFVWILVINFKFLIFNFYLNSNVKNSKLNSYSLLLITIMVTILIQGLVDSPIWKNDLVVMLWLLLAIAYVLGEGNDDKNN